MLQVLCTKIVGHRVIKILKVLVLNTYIRKERKVQLNEVNIQPQGIRKKGQQTKLKKMRENNKNKSRS